MELINFINIILQSILFSYIPLYCVSGRKEMNRKKILLITFLNFVIIHFIFSLSNGDVISIYLINFLQLFIFIILFKESKKVAILSFTIVNFIIGAVSFFSSIVFNLYIIEIIDYAYIDLFKIIVVYIPQLIIFILLIKFKNQIYYILRCLLAKKHSLLFVIVETLILDYIVSFAHIYSDANSSPILQNMVFMIFILNCSILITYLIKVVSQYSIIVEVNKKLNDKVIELQKIKHDYGSQISYLHGLCLMKRYEKLESLLKDIINGYNESNTGIEVLQEESYLTLLVKNLVDKSINLIIDENLDILDLDIDDLDASRIISNIVVNANTALRKNGNLIIKTKTNLNYGVISIKNDGPKIDSQIIDRIFEVKFSTKKENIDECGYGLAIVKELIEKNNGNISVVSTNEYTEFIIKIPLKK